MTQIQNSKRVIRHYLCQMVLSPADWYLYSDTKNLRWMFWSLDIEIWDLFVIWCLWFGIYFDVVLQVTVSLMITKASDGVFHNPQLAPRTPQPATR